MIFQSQYDQLQEKGRIQFMGTALTEETEIVFITGIKASSGNIITTVEYLKKDGTREVAFNRDFEPVDFEKFLNRFAMTVAKTENSSGKVIELPYQSSPLDDTNYPDLDEGFKNQALRIYLAQLTQGINHEIAYKRVVDNITIHN